MNLSAYDVIKGINRSATWIDPKYKKLYSREIKSRAFYGFAKNFNPNNNEYNYYLILTDNNTDDNTFVRVIDRFKPLKIPLNRIWLDISVNITNATNINVINVEHSDDTDIYLIDI